MFHWPTVIDHPGGLVVISDALASPGEFILHDIVVGCTKGQDKFCVLVSLNESIDHWKNIASRLVSVVQTYFWLKFKTTGTEYNRKLGQHSNKWSAGVYWQSSGT